MVRLIRHLVAIIVLPFTVAVLVPIWIALATQVRPAFPDSAALIAQQACGAAIAAVGLLLFGSSLRRFAGEGDGTLAPWDPPRHLVVRGPYRFVRNPMISGVVLVLFGEAAFLGSLPHATWAIIFAVMNLVYIPLSEEPGLLARFGDSYREYCRHVPRLVPRLTPWEQS
jgi:protein-S-isoprenylcysteine O-methyltransferase Ste14